MEEDRIQLLLKNNKAVIIFNDTLPESICGEDNRRQIEKIETTPYSWICQLIITTADDGFTIGSGWQINIPEVEHRVIVTSGHCIYQHDHGGYANQIEIRFPGQEPVNTTAIRASQEWINTKNREYDYGVILLLGEPGGFNWNSGFQDYEFHSLSVSDH